MAFAIKRLSLSRWVAQPLQKHYTSRLPSIKAIHHTSSQPQSFKSWYQSQWIPRKTEPPYSHIIQIGDPVLRQKCSTVPLDAINTKELNLFLDQLVDVLRGFKCVGLAAPQVGIGLRIIVMEFHDGLRDEFTADEYKVREMEKLPLTVGLIEFRVH